MSITTAGLSLSERVTALLNAAGPDDFPYAYLVGSLCEAARTQPQVERALAHALDLAERHFASPAELSEARA